jgi:signal transduction histidine kinase
LPARHTLTSEGSAESAAALALLYRLASSLQDAGSVQQIYSLALEAVCEGLCIERACIVLFDSRGALPSRGWRGVSETLVREIEGHPVWDERERHPRPIAVPDTEQGRELAAPLPLLRAEHVRAFALVPAVDRGRPVGELMLCSDEPRRFADWELELAEAVASHAAHEVERKRADADLSRLLQEEREARLQAEEARRAREDALAVVGHDLRNSLGAIVMSSASLLGLPIADPKAERVRLSAERILRQANRIARVIADLVDFLKLEAGELTIRPEAASPAEMIDAAAKLLAGFAEERGVCIELQVPAALPQVRCDRDRIVQAVANLISNALKVSAWGEPVVVAARREGGEIVISVADRGPGIEAGELAHLFERYWRSSKPEYTGSGIGLAMATGIVHAHGGRIWAHSTAGQGSTFFFTLPIAASSS